MLLHYYYKNVEIGIKINLVHEKVISKSIDCNGTFFAFFHVLSVISLKIEGVKDHQTQTPREIQTCIYKVPDNTGFEMI